MILIVASTVDEVAPVLAVRWAHRGARVLTPKDLSCGGWRWRLGASTSDAASCREGTIPTDKIHGVLTRLPCVSDRDLPHIKTEDRAYAGMEMQAFLFAWLAGLRCPVLNRPTAFCLNGPSWRPEQWVRLAAHSGLPVDPARRSLVKGEALQAAAIPGAEAIAVTIAGTGCAGSSDPVLIGRARQLAAAAGLSLLTVFFDRSDASSKFVGASPWANVADPVIADLVLACFPDAVTTALE